MARSTGRQSSSATRLDQVRVPADRWIDVSGLDLVVWAEEEGVVLYEGEKNTARRRRVLSASEAQELSVHLETAARRVRALQREAQDR